MTDSPNFPTVADLLRAYRRGQVTPTAVAEAALARIRSLEPTLNAFQLLDEAGALEAAAAADARWAEGRPLGPLDGVPLTIKDIVATKGWPTLSGSRTVDGNGPWDVDAPSVARLREGGAVILGKTTTPEFGWKGMTDSPLAGTTRNPWDPAHTPGGSSGGAAAALAAGIGAIAHGTDGGGSIRIPANYCGLFGIKPTYGRVPHAPNDRAFATLSCNGPIARTVEDAALMLNVISQPDDRDWRALPPDGRDYRIGLDDGVRGLRLAYAPELGWAEVAAEVLAATEAAVKSLDLSAYRVLAFATHGLIPGDLDGLTQPALALSAPAVVGGTEDGLLTMGEILGLKLDADWVVLSACNTGSGEGAGAEAVSGLGRAFFYAGTRALLVSNWPVETTSAMALTTELFGRQAAEPTLGRAKALRGAMLSLIDGPGYVDSETDKSVFSYAHPIFWAPFSLIGDGGSHGPGV